MSLYYNSSDKLLTKQNMYYHINKCKKELGVSKISVDHNLVQEICDLEKLAGNHDFIQRCILNKSKNELPAIVLYFKDSLYDLFSLIVNSKIKCLIQIDKTFDSSEFYITSLSYKNCKLYRRKTKEPPFFILPFFIHASSKTSGFEEFFKTIEIDLQDKITDEKCYFEDWKSK